MTYTLSPPLLDKLRGEAIEVYPLGSLIRRDAGTIEGATPVVVVRTSTGALGCAVDELPVRAQIVLFAISVGGGPRGWPE